MEQTGRRETSVQDQSDLACSQLITLVSDNYSDSFITDLLNADMRRSRITHSLHVSVRKLAGRSGVGDVVGWTPGSGAGDLHPLWEFLSGVRTGLAESEALEMRMPKGIVGGVL